MAPLVNCVCSIPRFAQAQRISRKKIEEARTGSIQGRIALSASAIQQLAAPEDTWVYVAFETGAAASKYLSMANNVKMEGFPYVCGWFGLPLL